LTSEVTSSCWRSQAVEEFFGRYEIVRWELVGVGLELGLQLLDRCLNLAINDVAGCAILK